MILPDHHLRLIYLALLPSISLYLLALSKMQSYSDSRSFIRLCCLTSGICWLPTPKSFSSFSLYENEVLLFHQNSESKIKTGLDNHYVFILLVNNWLGQRHVKQFWLTTVEARNLVDGFMKQFCGCTSGCNTWNCTYF